MSIAPNEAEAEEARLTAYALGELDAGERELVEEMLEGSVEARQLLEAIRETAELLRAEFSNEPVLQLHEAQVEAIVGERAVADRKVVDGGFLSRHWNLVMTGAVAACACLIAVVGMKGYLAGLEQRDEIANVSRAHAAEEGAEKDVPAVGSVAESPMAMGAPAPGGDLPRVAADEPPGGERPESDGLLSRSLAGPVDKESSAAVRSAVAPLVRKEGATDPKMESKIAQSPPTGILAKSARSDESVGADATPLARRQRPNGSGLQPAAPLDTLQPLPQTVPSSRPLLKRDLVEKSEALADEDRAGVRPAPAAMADEPSRGREEEALVDSANRGGPDVLVEPAALAQKLLEAGDRVPGAGGGDAAATAAGSGDGSVLPDDAGGERYGKLVDNPWVSALDDPLSTFAIDVDTGTYPNVRRFLTRRASLPPRDAVRIEEMINYFEYDYPLPVGGEPFAVGVEVASCPWAKDHRLVRVGLKGKEVAVGRRPPSNLVFLIDVSGSMGGADKLGLLKRSMKAMVGQLNEDDRIGIVTYAGDSGVLLEPTHGDAKETINGVLDKLESGGSTNGASGIVMAYELAKANLVEGTNRVILATDGDFNIGVTDSAELVRMVEERAGEHIYLTVLGFGAGNLQEERMEQLADKGNGSYHYIDSEKEGEKVLVRGLGATLVTVAKDVKVQVDFNPGKVGEYRLLGYANRMLPDKAFDDPAADAGEVGAGHTVTALYEVVPAGGKGGLAAIAGAGGQQEETALSRGLRGNELPESDELLTVKLNYKLPEDDQVAPTIEIPVVDAGKDWSAASEDFRFAAAVAGFGLLLRGGDDAGLLNYDLVLELGNEGITPANDAQGLRSEFINLVKTAKSLSAAQDPVREGESGGG